MGIPSRNPSKTCKMVEKSVVFEVRPILLIQSNFEVNSCIH